MSDTCEEQTRFKLCMLPFIRSDINHITGYTSHFKSSLKSLEQSETTSAVTEFDHLDKNENPFDLPNELKQMLACIYQEKIDVNRYPDHEHTTLKEAIAEYVNESASLHRQPKGITYITPNNISVGVGADELIQSLLIATCISKEGTILIAKPTFPMYEILAQILGIPVVAVGRDEKNFELDLVAAQSAIETTQNPPIRIVFAVHPNSPTGNLLTVSEIDWLRCLPEEIMVVIDEAYFEFSQTTAVGELLERPNWVVLRTFSKAFRLAAHRIGYAIAHPELTTVLEKVRLPYNLSSFSQRAAQVVLANRQVLMSSIPQILAERDRLICTLAQNPSLQVWPSAANFFYLRLQEHSDDGLALLSLYLKAQGTLVRPLGGGLRITVGNNDENIRMIKRLQAYLCL